MLIYKIRYIYLLFTILFITAAAAFSYWLYKSDSEIDLISFTISLVSLTISLMAFFIALNTFTSIDSVNKITKMEGNILENEHYVISLGSLMKQYHARSLKETEDKIFESLEIKFKKESKTSIEFTENLIHFIDIIIFFPALFNAKDINKAEYENQMKAILKLINKKKNDLIAINTGNRIQISETVKLIEGVIAYQNFISNNKLDGDTVLLEVRGPLLRNGVTRTVYFNYLGLLYNKKAMAIIRNILNLENKDLLEIENLIYIQKHIHQITGNDRVLAMMFLNDSREAFKLALSHCKEDTMWLGFIKYNDARSCFFHSLFSETNMDTNWLDIFNEAVNARSKLNILIREVLKSKTDTSHLQNSFLYQEELAQLVRLNLLLSQKIIDENNNNVLIYKGTDITKNPSILNNFKRNDQYPILKKYHDHILTAIRKQ